MTNKFVQHRYSTGNDEILSENSSCLMSLVGIDIILACIIYKYTYPQAAQSASLWPRRDIASGRLFYFDNVVFYLGIYYFYE